LKNDFFVFLDIPCGTIIYNTETELSFKETVQYSPNERCVWILQTMRASNYRVQIFSYGITNPNDGLTLTGIQRVGNPTPGSNEEVQMYECCILHQITAQALILQFNFSFYTLELAKEYMKFGETSPSSHSTLDQVPEDLDSVQRCLACFTMTGIPSTQLTTFSTIQIHLN